MAITLTPEQQTWIDAHVAQGQFASTEDAARILLDEAMSMYDRDFDDMSWAKPLIDEALAEVDRGETISAEEFRAKTTAYLATIKP